MFKLTNGKKEMLRIDGEILANSAKETVILCAEQIPHHFVTTTLVAEFENIDYSSRETYEDTCLSVEKYEGSPEIMESSRILKDTQCVLRLTKRI